MTTKIATRTMYLVRQIQLESQTRLNEGLRAFDLTAGEYTVMALLESRDRLSAAQLARRMSMTPQSMNEVISSLERKQLVMRAEAPGNRRVLEATLTPAGRRLLAACNKVVDGLEADLYRGLNRGELSAFRRLLAKALARLRENAEMPMEAGTKAAGPTPDTGE